MGSEHWQRVEESGGVEYEFTINLAVRETYTVRREVLLQLLGEAGYELTAANAGGDETDEREGVRGE